MDRDRQYQPVEKTYFTEEEYQAYLMLKEEHSYNTPLMEAVLQKIRNRNPDGFEVRKDKRLMKTMRDMRTSVKLPPRASEEHYPRASDVSSHPHTVNMSDTGSLYASDYFLPNQNEYNLTFIPLERRVDKTPLSPIQGQGQAIFDSLLTEDRVFFGRQLAFQGNIPDAFRHGFVRMSD
jgi:hypothetical protein